MSQYRFILDIEAEDILYIVEIIRPPGEPRTVGKGMAKRKAETALFKTDGVTNSEVRQIEVQETSGNNEKVEVNGSQVEI